MKKVLIAARIDPELKQQVESVAATEKRSVSAVIAILLNEAVQAREDESE